MKIWRKKRNSDMNVMLTASTISSMVPLIGLVIFVGGILVLLVKWVFICLNFKIITILSEKQPKKCIKMLSLFYENIQSTHDSTYDISAARKPEKKKRWKKILKVVKRKMWKNKINKNNKTRSLLLITARFAL